MRLTQTVRRGMDVPVSASVTVKAMLPDDEFSAFVESARLRQGQAISLEFADLAKRSGIGLDELESKLLTWRDNGWLQYRSSGRGMYIELCRPDSDARANLQEVMDRHKARAKEKVRKLAEYAKTERCRHDYIARHFGEAPIEGCRSCDNCTRTSTPITITPDHTLILKGMLTLPIRLGKSGLVKALVASPRCPIQKHEWEPLGAFSGRTQDQVAKLIDDLVDWGYLERDGTPIRPLLTLTPAGRKLAVGDAETADA